MNAYYNEIDPYAAQWLRNLISAGHIAAGDVDERSIVDVRPDDLKGYTQCHFFAGIGGWSNALHLARWDDTRPVWTGSCPCQPFSAAGKQEGHADERHLWPHWARLIRECHPATIFGEQVAGAIAFGWLDEVFADLENEEYACAAAVLPACGVGSPHRRDRLWFVADSRYLRGRNGAEPSKKEVTEITGYGAFLNPIGEGLEGQCITRGVDKSSNEGGRANELAKTDSLNDVAHPTSERQQGQGQYGIWGGQAQDREGQADNAFPECFSDFWRVEPDVGRVANGIPARVGKLRSLGNAIVPQVAAEFIKATM